ncbi:type VII secretion integral membrane protein EccD [Kitasatospora sp. NPDC052896]|uniref:type VII secretion integral membrane protein EccD n=1 Tax=Kitasatospora sp. NPDC052896 TaxID=3364061 RepID=UPI0037CC85FA
MVQPTAAGFCRLTVTGAGRRVDLALPEDVPLADLYPEVWRLCGEPAAEGEPVGRRLVRRDGSALDPSRSLAAQRVLDGELLLLRPCGHPPPAPIYDDVTEAVAAAVRCDPRHWHDGRLLFFGLTSGVLLLTLAALLLWSVDPVRHLTRGLPGTTAAVLAVLLVALAGARSRVYDDRPSAVALGLGALPHALVAGTALLPPDAGAGPGRSQLLAGCTALLITSVLLVVLLPLGDAPFVAAALLAATGVAAAFGTILTGAAPSAAAAVAGVAAVGLIGFLPGLAARFARLPIAFRDPLDGGDGGSDSGDGGGDEGGGGGGPDRPGGPQQPDAERIAALARRGHELLLGLVGGCAAVLVVAAGVLGGTDSAFARLLAPALGLAALLRARLFRLTGQVVALLVAGLGTFCLLTLGLATHPPAGARALGPVLALTLLAAVLLTVGVLVPRGGLTPRWGRLLELVDAAVLLSLVPLCLGVLDLYARARAMGG